MAIRGEHSGSERGGLSDVRERRKIHKRKGGKMGQFYQTDTRPQSWPKHGRLGKKTHKLDRHTNT